MMKIFLIVVVMLMLVVVCYGQLYEPEHLWHRCGVDSGDWFGIDIAGIGDVNNDGYEDFLASTETYSNPNGGYALLFYGGDPPDTIADLTFNNPYPHGYFGRQVTNVGDVNNDGWDDIAIKGGHQPDDYKRVYIYFGGDILDTIPDVFLNEAAYLDAFGTNIEGVGDVNNDGYDDVAVFAANYETGSGKVWVYLGGSPMDSIADWSQQGVDQQVFYGQSIAGKGDLNGDGYDDFAVYEWTGYPNNAQTTYYVYFGGVELDTIPDVIIDGENYYPSVDISNHSAMILNLNGDPYADLVISAGRTSNMIVFHGGNPMDTDIDLILQGFDPNPPGGWNMEVSATGDVNGDGYGDIIASQLAAYGNGGIVLVYLGNPWMDGYPDMRWLCLFEPWDGCGKSLANCGDINGDGVDDMMFGSYDTYSNTQGCIDVWLGDTSFVVNVPEQMPQAAPNLFQLHEPYPNPFNNTVTVPFEIFPGLDGDVSLIVYNVLGQLVADLRPAVKSVMKGQRMGYYEVIWDGKDPSGIDVGSGIYIVVLHISTHRQLQKLTLLR